MEWLWRKWNLRWLSGRIIFIVKGCDASARQNTSNSMKNIQLQTICRHLSIRHNPWKHTCYKARPYIINIHYDTNNNTLVTLVIYSKRVICEMINWSWNCNTQHEGFKNITVYHSAQKVILYNITINLCVIFHGLEFLLLPKHRRVWLYRPYHLKERE